MKYLTKRTLRVFSVLEQYGEGSTDPLDALLPFFEPILASFSGNFYDPELFAEQVRSQLHWNFTRDIAEELCAPFLKRGWLAKETQSNSNVIYKVTHEPSHADEAQIQHNIETRLKEITLKFRAFIDELSPLTSFSRTDEELADILVEWLVSIDAYSEDVLQYSVRSGKQNASGKLGFSVYIPDTCSLQEEEKFLAARFVKNLFDTDSQFTTDLCKIASVGLLTEVVQDFHKPSSSVKKTDLTVYLDAPVAMDLLGVSGKAAKANIEPIIKEFTNIGGRLRIFGITLNEVRGALTAVLQRDVRDRTGPTADALRKGEVLEAYVRTVAANPGTMLTEHFGVGIDERSLAQFPNEQQYFTDDQHDLLYSEMGFHLEPKRREHDAQTTTLIMRKRHGYLTPDLFASRFMLLTRNGVLAQYSQRLCRQIKLINSSSVGPVLHQRAFATAIWLRTGLSGEAKEIPKRYVLAACEKVLEVKKGLIEYVQKISSNLTPEQAEQLDLLMSHDRSVQHLQDKTLGGISSIVSSSTPQLLLQTLKDGLLAEEKEKSNAQILELEATAQETIKQEKLHREDAERKTETLSQLMIERQKEDLKMLVAAANAASEHGQKIEKRYKIGVVTVLIVFGLYLWLGPELKGSNLGPVLFLLLGVGIPVTLAAFQLFDKALRIDKLANKAAEKHFEKLVKRRKLQQKLLRNPVTFSRCEWDMRGYEQP